MLLFCKIPSKSGYLGLKHSLWLAKQAILNESMFFILFLYAQMAERLIA